ncbi:MAG: hypothetical protein AABY22_30490 [Nanoarchaeota archaeon]
MLGLVLIGYRIIYAYLLLKELNNQKKLNDALTVLIKNSENKK